MKKLKKRELCRKWIRSRVFYMSEIKSRAVFIRELEEDINALRLSKADFASEECNSLKRDLIKNYENIIRKSKEKSDEYQRLADEFEECLEILNDRERTVTKKRYMEFLPWEKLTYIMHYELASLTRFEASAIEKIYEYLTIKKKICLEKELEKC